VWAPAVEPIHFDKPIAGVGPGLAFGKAMADKKPDIYIGLIPCAAGGSSITHWRRGEWFEQTGSHPYDDAIGRTKTAMKSGVLKGILWHQGEGDSREESAPVYEQNLAGLIASIRQDLGVPDVPFIVGRLGDYFTEPDIFFKASIQAYNLQATSNRLGIQKEGITDSRITLSDIDDLFAGSKSLAIVLPSGMDDSEIADLKSAIIKAYGEYQPYQSLLWQNPSQCNELYLNYQGTVTYDPTKEKFCCSCKYGNPHMSDADRGRLLKAIASYDPGIAVHIDKILKDELNEL